MYDCNLCNKLFKYESDFIRHQSRKTLCNIPKEKLECELCNLYFNCKTELVRHENTNKHLIKLSNNKNAQDLKNKENNILDTQNKELKNKIFKLENKMINLEVENDNLNNKMINLEVENQNTVNELNTRIKHLEVENINLKNNQKLHPDYESIYIIHSAQHVNTNIYKIGRTENINARRVNYPSGSDLLYSFSCKDAKTVENTILDYLKINKEIFKLMDFGREYFQCNLKDLRNAVLKFID